MKKKSIIALVCVAALALGSMFGTLAYLTDTEAATNVFTVGKVGIALDEENTDKDEVDGAIPERDTSNDYHLIPGHTYPKDPTVHVDADSEDCWLFVKIDNGIADIIESADFAKQLSDNGWTQLKVDGKEVAGVYTHDKYVKGSSPKDFKVFGSFTVKGSDVDNDQLAAYEGKKITVTAYAIQAAGFADAASAWTAGNWK